MQEKLPGPAVVAAKLLEIGLSMFLYGYDYDLPADLTDQSETRLHNEKGMYSRKIPTNSRPAEIVTT